MTEYTGSRYNRLTVIELEADREAGKYADDREALDAAIARKWVQEALEEIDGKLPTLIAHAKRRADILNASAAWGACDDGMLIQQLVARIEKLEAQKGQG
jgi:malate synthase